MKTKIVERELEDGSVEYGVQYHDGHTKWFGSLSHAQYAYEKNIEKKKHKVPT
jgi:hypothetical protein